MWHLWIVGEKIKRVGSNEVCSNVTFRAWLGRKDVWSLSFQFATFFCRIQGPCLCRRGELVFAVTVFYYVCCFLQLFSTALNLFWVKWLRLIIIEQTHKQTLKGGRAGSASRLDSSIFEEGWEERALKKARGVLPNNKPYRYVPPQRVGFLRRFRLKTGLGFAQFGLESGMGVYERIYR